MPPRLLTRDRVRVWVGLSPAPPPASADGEHVSSSGRAEDADEVEVEVEVEERLWTTTTRGDEKAASTTFPDDGGAAGVASVARMVANAREMEAVGAVDGVVPVVVPVTITTPTSKETYVTSLRAHYVWYAHDEVRVHVRNPVVAAVAHFVLNVVDVAAALCRLDDAVFVNNLLVSTNLYPARAIPNPAHVTKELVDLFPTRAIVWRSLDPVTTPTLLRDLQHSPDVVLLFSRLVNHFDPTEAGVWRRSALNSDALVYERAIGAVRADVRAVQKGALTLEELHARAASRPDDAQNHAYLLQVLPTNACETDPSLPKRLQELYASLYLAKYSPHNPDYSPAFFRHAIQTGMWRVTVLRKRHGPDQGRVDGFIACIEMGEWLTSPALGYDASVQEQSLGDNASLYATLQFNAMLEARSRGRKLNMSGGVAAYKRARGAKSCVEFVAVSCQHLSWPRRAFVRVLGWLSAHVVVPLVSRKLAVSKPRQT